MAPPATPAVPRQNDLSYVCQIESNAVTRVALRKSSSMESIKRAFRSIFKRQKKNKPEQENTQPGATGPMTVVATTTTGPSQHASSVQQQAKALPLTPASPPPTQDGPRDVNHKGSAAAAEAAPVSAVPEGLEAEDKVGEGYTQTTSEVGMPPLGETKEVYGAEEDKPPAPPPKEGIGEDAAPIVPGEAALAAPAGSESLLVHSQCGNRPANQIDEAKKGNVPPVAMDAPSGEDKIPVMVEPPPIKPISPAPGMSATSGPLEDFPEGGEYRA